MNKIVKRLKSKAGESLVESMAAILIFTLASITMYTMIMAANDINLLAQEADETYMEQLVVVEMAEGTPEIETVTFTMDGKNIPVEVEVYGGSDTLYAYYPKEG